MKPLIVRIAQQASIAQPVPQLAFSALQVRNVPTLVLPPPLHARPGRIPQVELQLARLVPRDQYAIHLRHLLRSVLPEHILLQVPPFVPNAQRDTSASVG